MGKKIAGLLIVLMLALSGTFVMNVGGEWTSPDLNETYTLAWLAANTNSVSTGQGENVYHLDDHITITQTNTLDINAGETLLFNKIMTITIEGNLDVGGTINSGVTFGTISSEESTNYNIFWGSDNNNLLFSYTTVTDIQIAISDGIDTTVVYSNGYSTDVVPVRLNDQINVKFEAGDPYKFSNDDAFKDYEFGTDYISDWDGDGMPDYWEDHTPGLSRLNSNDATGDLDGDGLSNLLEYQHRTNPRDSDTDDDGLNDNYEVTTNIPGGNLYYTSPLKQDTDGEIMDHEEVTLGTDNYKTDPTKKDSDGDGLKDTEELDDPWNTDPMDEDTDGDEIIDKRDNEPNQFNRRFAFLFEITNYANDNHDRLNGNVITVANDLADHGWTVELCTDYDYDNGDYHDGITWYETARASFAWFQTRWSSFKVSPNPDVGKREVTSSVGHDIVMVYLDAYAGLDNMIYKIEFPVTDQTDEYKFVTAVESEFDDLGNGDYNPSSNPNGRGNCIDFIWIQCRNAEDEWATRIASTKIIDTGDKFDGDERVVILGDGELDDDTDVWDDFVQDYSSNPDHGVYGVWIYMDETDQHERHDFYDLGNYDKMFIW